MSFSDVEAELKALNPPEFDSKCTMCGSRKRLLQWQTSTTDGCWGPVCSDCTKPLLIRLLRSRLPSTFSQAEITHVLNDLDLNKRECELLVDDFFKESVVLRTERGLSFLDDEPVVKPIFQSRKVGNRVYRGKTPEQIFRLCVRLSKEILNREGRIGLNVACGGKGCLHWRQPLPRGNKRVGCADSKHVLDSPYGSLDREG